MNRNEFKNKCEQRGLFLSDRQLEQYDEYASFLVEYNEKINLTAIVDYEAILEKHFYDSLLLSFEKKIEGSFVDVGTGAGFPGVVLKIAYPSLKVILLEPLQKRCIFLNELIKRLGLEDIEVVNVRGEDYSLKNREAFDYVSARAVTNLNALMEVAGAMVRVNGYFVALRGSSGLDEISQADNAIKQMGFVIEKTCKEELGDGSVRIISFLKKIKETPKKYPRKYSIIKQRPL